MATKSAKKENMSTYLLEFENGRRTKITVPSTWKVTFGPAVSGKDHDSRGRSVPMAIRFYASPTQQKAIFLNVKNFRDMSIAIEEEQIRTTQKDGFTVCDGVQRATQFTAQVREWVNPDITSTNSYLPVPTAREVVDAEINEG